MLWIYCAYSADLDGWSSRRRRYGQRHILKFGSTKSRPERLEAMRLGILQGGRRGPALALRTDWKYVWDVEAEGGAEGRLFSCLAGAGQAFRSLAEVRARMEASVIPELATRLNGVTELRCMTPADAADPGRLLAPLRVRDGAVEEVLRKACGFVIGLGSASGPGQS